MNSSLAGELELDNQLEEPAFSAICRNCRKPLSWSLWLNIENSLPVQCDCGVTLDKSKRAISPPSPENVDLSVELLLGRRWFHSSSRDNWPNLIEEEGDLLLHCGDSYTALARADHLLRSSSQVFKQYLYSFKLKRNDFRVYPVLVADMCGGWPERVGEACHGGQLIIDYRENVFSNLKPFNALGYWNTFEVSGTLSLIVAASSIDTSTMERRELF